MDEPSRRPAPRDSTARNIVDDQTVETSRTLLAVRAMCGILRHTGSGVSEVDPHGTTRRHPAGIEMTGAMRDEKQEEQCCEPSGGPLGAWQSPTERQPGNPVEEGAERLRSSPTAIKKGGNAAMYHEQCEICGNRWQRILLTMVARDPERTLCNRTMLSSTVKRPVEIERPFSPHGREHDDAGHASAKSLLGMLDVQCDIRAQPGRVHRSPCGPGEIRGRRREHGSHWRGRDPVPLRGS